MAVPTEVTWSVAALEDASDAVLALIDAGTGAGKIKIRDSADVLLSTVTLTDPAGTVSGVTGALTLTPAGADTSPAANGTAAYAEITDSDDTVIVSLPAVAGVSAVSGYIVLNNLTIVTTGEVTVSSAVIG